VIGISVPALNERIEDIELLATHILQKLSEENATHYSLDPSALLALKAYTFPGNVRELENILERASALSDNNKIKAQDLNLPEQENTSTPAVSLLDKTTELEAEELEKALHRNKWNQSAAARQLGITLRQLRYRCQKLGLTKTP
jgi:two-component system response regulator PilR (NtrC family)